MLLGWDYHGSDLLICEELNSGVGEDTKEGCGVAAEEASETILVINVTHGGYDAEPAASVLGELRIGSLEEDLYAVERTDNCFGLT
jgi:hypothetical protein